LRKISIESTGPDCYGCLAVTSPSHDISITGCRLYQTAGSIYGSGIVVSDAYNITIQNNTIDVEVDCISILEVSGSIILSNFLIDNNTIVCGYNASFMSELDGLTYTNNNVVSGTYAFQVSNSKGAIVIANNSITGGEGGVVCADFGSPSTLDLYNNFILVTTGASAPVGLALQSIPEAEVYHNTVRVTSASSSDPTLLLTGAGNYKLRNNIFVNSASGVAFYFQSGRTYDLNNNIYFNTGSNLGYAFGFGFFSSLTAYTTATGQESTGMEVNPLLVSSTNLHIQATSPARDAGVSLLIPNDIDGQVREPLSDIGADEYYPPIGIDEASENSNGIIIFPNPTNGEIFIHTDKAVKQTINVYSVDGSLAGTYVPVNGMIDISPLAKGVYFLNFDNQTVKCIKK
jgi:hypothetical protein